MYIANPIYDVVFRHLMEDPSVARLILSTIIGREVLEVDFQPQERSFSLSGHDLTVYRLDFAARIQTSDGESQQVLIEIQKAKFPTDIMRFRRYLGAQYADEQNTRTHQWVDGRLLREALPIISIYFLGHTLEHCVAPVIKVNRHYTDMATGEILHCKERFIESLTHDSYIIQIPYLSTHKRTDLERLLTVFDQSRQAEDKHMLNVDAQELPENYKVIIRRLQAAVSAPKIRENMVAEDEILIELENSQRAIARLSEALEDKNKVLENKDKELENKDKELEEQNKTLEGKDKLIANLMAQLHRNSDLEP